MSQWGLSGGDAGAKVGSIWTHGGPLRDCTVPFCTSPAAFFPACTPQTPQTTSHACAPPTRSSSPCPLARPPAVPPLSASARRPPVCLCARPPPAHPATHLRGRVDSRDAEDERDGEDGQRAKHLPRRRHQGAPSHPRHVESPPDVQRPDRLRNGKQEAAHPELRPSDAEEGGGRVEEEECGSHRRHEQHVGRHPHPPQHQQNEDQPERSPKLVRDGNSRAAEIGDGGEVLAKRHDQAAPDDGGADHAEETGDDRERQNRRDGGGLARLVGAVWVVEGLAQPELRVDCGALDHQQAVRGACGEVQHHDRHCAGERAGQRRARASQLAQPQRDRASHRVTWAAGAGATPQHIGRALALELNVACRLAHGRVRPDRHLEVIARLLITAAQRLGAVLWSAGAGRTAR
eukprot:scaffold7374_cov112-Isochrysis_galbana.AAC.22